MRKILTDELYLELPEKGTRLKSFALNTLKTLVILVTTVIVTELMYRFRVGDQSLLMVYILSVLVVSRITPTYIHGIISAVLSTFAYDFFVTHPRLGFSFLFTSDFPVTLVSMLLATFLTSTLTIQAQSQANLANKRGQHAQLLYEINQKLLAARDLDSIVDITNDYLISHLKRAAIFYTEDPLEHPDGFSAVYGANRNPDVFSAPEEQKAVHRIFQKSTGPKAIADEPEPGVYYVPVVSKGCVLGVIGIDCNEQDLSQGDLTFIRTLVGQVALALELQLLSDEQGHSQIEAEKEKMRSSLLRSISHDLRTPLTSIVGAGETILADPEMDRKAADNLVRDIMENAKWLIRMVENILTVTRISKDHMTVNKTMEAAEEVIAQSVSIVRGRFPDYHIHVDIPDEAVFVPMDATLVSQVIINLLENAVKNSPDDSLIFLDLKKQSGYAQFDVYDNGRGISANLLDSLFEIHSPCNEPAVDAARGMGIGLSICKTIIQAHNGTIEGYNRDKGGAKFSFRLPLQEVESVAGQIENPDS